MIFSIHSHVVRARTGTRARPRRAAFVALARPARPPATQHDEQGLLASCAGWDGGAGLDRVFPRQRWKLSDPTRGPHELGIQVPDSESELESDSDSSDIGDY